MKKVELCEIKGSYEICSSSDFIVFAGPELIIFRQGGSFVASHNDLGNVRKCVFVSSDTILVDYSAQKFYSLISLADGSEIWRISQPKSDYTCSRFALSPDKQYVYDRYDLRGKYYFVKIDLKAREIHKQPIQNDMRCVSDLICNQQGNPVFLEQHYEENESELKKSISKNGIICACTKGSKQPHFFKQVYQWDFPYPRIAKYFLGNEDTILTQDLYVYNPSTGEFHSLIENEKIWGNPGNSPAGYHLNNEQYVTLMYDTVNVIVDWKARKMCARYAANYRFGCIVGNEYWICADEGLIRKPFPIIEDIPTKKHTFWSPWK